MRMIKRKILRTLNYELDNIIKQQKNPPKENPIFKDFNANFAKKLKKHTEFMASIERTIESTK
ncbi:hypothetical protein KVG29_08665 [Caldicoprobacter algeriensis]|uniref:hypothetical protein n=1 Tax=Caldicoprobacter algeriensis TaxID=699281 RepID=UPI00207936F4|nr:hypothetical protein [Caldicoprobacter algeriensis]MCM8901290.1 hypothetical protein [Caldicoprobacter algeriensis]